MSAKLEELQEIARVATLKALEGYPISEEMRTQLVLGVQFEGDVRIFELYLPGERPQDALIISEATVHRVTKDVTVRVFNPPQRGEGTRRHAL
jgi:hypothetical protein